MTAASHEETGELQIAKRGSTSYATTVTISVRALGGPWCHEGNDVRLSDCVKLSSVVAQVLNFYDGLFHIAAHLIVGIFLQNLPVYFHGFLRLPELFIAITEAS